MIGIVACMALMLVGFVLAIVKAPKPFSLLQKLGVLTSGLALLSVFVFPIASLYGGIRKFNLMGTFAWLMEQSERETSFLCEYDFFAVMVVAMLVFVPLLSAALYCCNRGKTLGGILLLMAPLYLTAIFNLCHSLEATSLSIGGIIPLLCGIALIVLPWLVKEKDERPQMNARFVGFIIGSMALSAFVPAAAMQYLIHYDEEQKELRKMRVEDELKEREARAEAAVLETGAVDATFMAGDITHYLSLKVSDLDYSGANYEYIGKYKYTIQIVSDHGSMVMKAWSGEGNAKYMDAGTFFDDICDEYDEVSNSCEYGFAQHDFDHDGEDEVIIAARINSEFCGNAIAVNVYRMRDLHCWSLPMPRDEE